MAEDYAKAVANLNNALSDVEINKRVGDAISIWTGIKNYLGIENYAQKNNLK